MKKEEIATKIKEIIAEKLWLDVDEINNESNLMYDLGFDEWDKIEVVMEIEKKYSISIKDSDLDSIEIFEELIDHTFNLIK